MQNRLKKGLKSQIGSVVHNDCKGVKVKDVLRDKAKLLFQLFPSSVSTSLGPGLMNRFVFQ